MDVILFGNRKDKIKLKYHFKGLYIMVRIEDGENSVIFYIFLRPFPSATLRIDH